MALAGLLLVGAEGGQARIGALRDGVGQDQRVGTGDLGQAQLIDGAGERRQRRGGNRLVRRGGTGDVAADRRGGVERRQAGGHGRGLAARDEQRDVAGIGFDRDVRPLAGLDGLAGGAALAIDLHERNALVHTHDELAGAVAADIKSLFGAELVGTHPGGERERRTGLQRQRRRSGQHQRRDAELGALADDRAVDADHGGLRMVAIGGGVTRRHIGLGEVIDQRVVGIESELAVGRGRRLGIAVVHPQLLRAAGRDVGHVDPDQRDAQQRIELLDLVIEHGLVVARDETQIGAVLADALEAEVAGMQADQHGGAARLAAQGGALRRGIDRDGFAVGPVGLPPGLSQAGQDRAQHREREKQNASHGKLSEIFSERHEWKRVAMFNNWR